MKNKSELSMMFVETTLRENGGEMMRNDLHLRHTTKNHSMANGIVLQAGIDLGVKSGRFVNDPNFVGNRTRVALTDFA